MRDDGLAHDAAGTRHDVDDASRESDFVGRLSEQDIDAAMRSAG